MFCVCVNYEVKGQEHDKQVKYIQDSDFSKEKRRDAMGRIRTHHTVQSRLSALTELLGFKSSMEYNTRQTSNHCVMAQYTLSVYGYMPCSQDVALLQKMIETPRNKAIILQSLKPNIMVCAAQGPTQIQALQKHKI